MIIRDYCLWNDDKNAQLRRERGLSFEAVMSAIEEGKLLADIPHPSPSRAYQRILVVDIDGYACAVPYVSDGGKRFLKTIYRSRVLHKLYAVRKKP